MEHIGTITDRSYYQEYSRIKGNRIYYCRICPICDEELDEGFSDLDGGNRVGALPHICRKFEGLGKKSEGRFTPEKPKLEWGQFSVKMKKQNE